MIVPMLPVSDVPRAKMTVSGAQTPFSTSLAVLPPVYFVVLPARLSMGLASTVEIKAMIRWEVFMMSRKQRSRGRGWTGGRFGDRKDDGRCTYTYLTSFQWPSTSRRQCPDRSRHIRPQSIQPVPSRLLMHRKGAVLGCMCARTKVVANAFCECLGQALSRCLSQPIRPVKMVASSSLSTID